MTLKCIRNTQEAQFHRLLGFACVSRRAKTTAKLCIGNAAEGANESPRQ